MNLFVEPFRREHKTLKQTTDRTEQLYEYVDCNQCLLQADEVYEGQYTPEQGGGGRRGRRGEEFTTVHQWSKPVLIFIHFESRTLTTFTKGADHFRLLL